MRLMLILLFLFLPTAFAKRAAPAEVQPVHPRGIEYSLRVETSPCRKSPCGMKASLVARDTKSQNVKWERELYQRQFLPEMEQDVQAIFPKSLRLLKGGTLRIVDEKGTVYLVSREGELLKPLKSVIYPAPKR